MVPVNTSKLGEIVRATIETVAIKLPRLDLNRSTYIVYRLACKQLRHKILCCIGLMALQYLWNILGWSNDALVGFIWDEKIVDEVLRLLADVEEYDLVNSYLPYLIDFVSLSMDPLPSPFC